MKIQVYFLWFLLISIHPGHTQPEQAALDFYAKNIMFQEPPELFSKKIIKLNPRFRYDGKISEQNSRKEYYEKYNEYAVSYVSTFYGLKSTNYEFAANNRSILITDQDYLLLEDTINNYQFVKLPIPETITIPKKVKKVKNIFRKEYPPIWKNCYRLQFFMEELYKSVERNKFDIIVSPAFLYGEYYYVEINTYLHRNFQFQSIYIFKINKHMKIIDWAEGISIP